MDSTFRNYVNIRAVYLSCEVCVFIVVFLLSQFCTYGQLLELKLLAFLSGILHILLFISAYCANK